MANELSVSGLDGTWLFSTPQSPSEARITKSSNSLRLRIVICAQVGWRDLRAEGLTSGCGIMYGFRPKSPIDLVILSTPITLAVSDLMVRILPPSLSMRSLSSSDSGECSRVTWMIFPSLKRTPRQSPQWAKQRIWFEINAVSAVLPDSSSPLQCYYYAISIQFCTLCYRIGYQSSRKRRESMS